MSVVHVIPSGVFANTYHGSYKDTISRVRFLETRVDGYRQICLDVDDPRGVLRVIDPGTRPSFLIEYSSFPNVVRTLRRQFPKAFIAVRSHNLEPLQHFDNHGWWPTKGPLWLTYGMGHLFRSDLICKRYASAIWSISDWENRVYWNRLPGRAAVQWFPYSCPAHLLPPSTTPLEHRHRIACMPTSEKNRKSWDLVTRFIAFAEKMKEVTRDQFEYVITGRLSDWGLPDSSAVAYTGMVDDLNSFLQSVRAVAMLSDKGYGFKTTIGDAIANGALAIVDAGLNRRCPRVFDEGLIVLNSLSPPDIAAAAQQLGSRQSIPELDLRCREQALQILSDAFLKPTAVSANHQPAC